MRKMPAGGLGLRLVLNVWALGLVAQISTGSAGLGSIAGRVTDPTGTGIPGAQVTVTKESTGEQFRIKTDSEGSYQLTGLVAGRYSVRIVEQGFVPEGKTGIVVNAKQETQLDAKLQVGQCTLTCEVQAEYAPPAPGFTLRLSGDRDVITVGSALWVTVVLTNAASHPIFVDATPGPNPTFAYQIQALGICGCGRPDTELGRQRKREMGLDPDTGGQLVAGATPTRVRIPPRGALTDRVDVTKLINLDAPGSYQIRVQGADTANSSFGKLLISSNWIGLTVVAPR